MTGEPGEVDPASIGEPFWIRRLPLLVGLLALAVFALWYWNPAYRYDEFLVAVARTRLSWPQLLEVIRSTDPAPALLYVLMKPWTAISSDPAWTRVPSVLAMAVAVGALVAFVRRAVDPRTAAFTGILAIALPGMSRWAQDNRMYAAASAFLVLALLCWWRSVAGGGRRWSLGYGAAVFAMGMFHVYTLTWLAVLVLGAVWVPGERRAVLSRTLVPPLIAGVLLLPILLLNLATPTGSPTNPPATVMTLAILAASVFGIPLTVVVALLAIVGAVRGWPVPDRRPVLAIGVAWVLLPLAAAIAARLVLDMPTLAARYAVFLVPGACMVGGMGLSALHARWPAATLVATALICVLAVPEGLAVRAPDGHRDELYTLRTLLADEMLTGVPVIGLTRVSEVWIDAATYPDHRRTAWDESPGDVVAVVHSSNRTVTGASNRYLVAGGPWLPLVRCESGPYALELLATSEGRDQVGDPADLVRDVTARLPQASCTVAPSGP